MTKSQIISAVRNGKTVHWSNELYKVVEDFKDSFIILCDRNKYCVGLTYKSTGELIGNENDFYVSEIK